MSMKLSAEEILDRAERPYREPEVREAADRFARASEDREVLDARVKALADRIGAAERRVADAVLAGKEPDPGEDLPSLRLARRDLLEQLRAADSTVERARDERDASAAKAKARLAAEFRAEYGAAIAELIKQLDEAVAANVRVRDLGYRGRHVLDAASAPEAHYHGLVPAEGAYFTRFAGWRQHVETVVDGKGSIRWSPPRPVVAVEEAPTAPEPTGLPPIHVGLGGPAE